MLRVRQTSRLWLYTLVAFLAGSLFSYAVLPRGNTASLPRRSTGATAVSEGLYQTGGFSRRQGKLELDSDRKKLLAIIGVQVSSVWTSDRWAEGHNRLPDIAAY